MTELLEAVAIELASTLSPNSQCTPYDPSGNQKARVHGIDGVECTAVQLLKNMDANNAVIPKIPQRRVLMKDTATKLNDARVAKAKAKGAEIPEPITSGYEIADCNPGKYPFQTHHLIPKAYIRRRPVAKWLAANAKGSKLAYDSAYDTDCAENGYCLPFYSSTRDWYDAKAAHGSAAKTKAQEIAAKMIVATTKQIHQGDHKAEDFLEQDAIESAGYLDMTKRLLDLISNRARNHTRVCKECKKKDKVPPRKEVVAGMHGVSSILMANINAWKIFVSRVSAMYRKNPNPNCTPWTKGK